MAAGEIPTGLDVVWSVASQVRRVSFRTRTRHVSPASLYRHAMTDAEPPSGPLWTYRFSQPDGTEIETREFSGDATAESWGRELSESNNAAVVIRRHSRHVDAWEYVDEVDERH